MLLYADDIVFLASTAEGLQEQLETLNNWSTKWALNVNIDKTKVLHVRKASVALCEYRFKLGNLVVDYTSQYRYLGFTLGVTLQGRIQDFMLGGGGALKKNAPNGGRRENCWGISCEKSNFFQF